MYSIKLIGLNAKTSMYPASALRHHQLKYELQEDITLLADRRVNPTLSTTRNLRLRWKNITEEHGWKNITEEHGWKSITEEHGWKNITEEHGWKNITEDMTTSLLWRSYERFKNACHNIRLFANKMKRGLLLYSSLIICYECTKR